MSPKTTVIERYPEASCWPVEKFGMQLLIAGAYCIVLETTPMLLICPGGGDSPRAAWKNALLYLNVVYFFDTNEEFYGTKKLVCTAICTTPITKVESDSAVGHLELFK